LKKLAPLHKTHASHQVLFDREKISDIFEKGEPSAMNFSDRIRSWRAGANDRDLNKHRHLSISLLKLFYGHGK
jgi:hypothetical protein